MLEGPISPSPHPSTCSQLPRLLTHPCPLNQHAIPLSPPQTPPSHFFTQTSPPHPPSPPLCPAPNTLPSQAQSTSTLPCLLSPQNRTNDLDRGLGKVRLYADSALPPQHKNREGETQASVVADTADETEARSKRFILYICRPQCMPLIDP